MTAISPFSLLKDANPAALALRGVSAAAELASDAKQATQGKSFSDLVDGLDANDDGRITGMDALGLASRGAASVVSAFTGVEIDTEPGNDLANVANTVAKAGREAATTLASGAPLPPAPPPSATVAPTVEGIHELYGQLRAMRS